MNRRDLILAAVAGLSALGAASSLPSEAEARGKGSSGGAKEAYITLPAATGMVPRRDGRRSSLTVEMGLEVPDAALNAHANLSRPRLSAAYNEIVRTTAARQRPSTPPDIEAIRTALQAATDRVLGRTGAKVLMGTVVVH